LSELRFFKETPMRKQLIVLMATVVAIAAFSAPAAAQDLLIPRRQPIYCPTTDKPYAFYQPIVDSTHSVVGWYCSATEPVVYNGSTLTATATELNKLAGVTAGTVSASKALVVDANKHLDVVKVTAGGLAIGASGSETAVTATAAELNVNAGVTGGTVTASKTVVVDANKAVDVTNTKTSRTLGGTGVAAAATTLTSITKVVTGIADATATDLVTVTIPNAAHAGVVHVRLLGSLGAGGAIGAFECSAVLEGNIPFARTAGVNAVAGTPSAAGMTSSACVAGATTITFAYSMSAVTGAVGATNTFTIKATITKGGGSSANHQVVVFAEILNSQATGITIS
jgi:hypothetical protein